METDGPLRIGVVETRGNAGRALQIGFGSTPERLAAGIRQLPESGRGPQGMQLTRQIGGHWMPRVEAGNLALHETIRVQVAQSAAVVTPSDLIEPGAS